MSKKSDRIIWLSFFFLMAASLMYAFLIFGPRPQHSGIDPTQNSDFQELGLEDEDVFDFTQTSPLYESRISNASSQDLATRNGQDDQANERSSTTQIQQVFSSSDDDFEGRLLKYLKPDVEISLKQSQDDLRRSLEKKGFVNQEYIEMRVLELDDSIADEALEKADSLYEKGAIGEAIEVLKQAFANTDFKNYLVRGMLSYKIMHLALIGAYPDQYINYSRQNLAIRSKVNAIKSETILMQNPIAKERLLNEQKSIDQLRANPGQEEAAMAGLKKNKGLPQAALFQLKAASLNAVRNSKEPNASEEMNKNFKLFQSQVRDTWSNPHE